MNFTEPQFKKKSFNCPLCGTFAHMDWKRLHESTTFVNYFISNCAYCSKNSLWRITKFEGIHNEPTNAELIYPDFGFASLPDNDMPDDVKTDYEEAAKIFSKSPRGSAALLRLGLQKLCKHLGEDGKNIDQDIRSLASKNILPPMVVKVADTVRITGNNAVHPGTMSNEDFDNVASKMFDLLNFIVKKGISEPKELERLYQLTPEGPRKSAEAKDAKSRQD
ncbi:DUF4145 domain-containing protein [Psychrobacter sp. T6-5]|uniref:DUF4145 domain-containing protein n=1 Tax=Psychrobacter sp. T6-5 TaxID=3457451 RepID=UPI003FD24A34